MNVDHALDIGEIIEQAADVARLGFRKRRRTVEDVATGVAAGLPDHIGPQDVVVAIDIDAGTAQAGVGVPVLSPPGIHVQDIFAPIRVDQRKDEHIERLDNQLDGGRVVGFRAERQTGPVGICGAKVVSPVDEKIRGNQLAGVRSTDELQTALRACATPIDPALLRELRGIGVTRPPMPGVISGPVHG